MDHPQTLADKLVKANLRFIDKSNLETIRDKACCAFVFLWCLHIEPEDLEAIKLVNDAINDKVLGEDCLVNWKKFGAWLTGRDIDVDFVPIKDLCGIIERTPVLYKYKGNEHWVGVEKNLLKFNPIEKSKCVEFGRPVEKRVIIMKGLAK